MDRFQNLCLSLGIERIPLICVPTPVHVLSGAAAALGHPALFVKREDATDTISYGGNKVRNLEFLLGDAFGRGAKRVGTLGPRGSNFVSALAAQAKRVGLAVEVYEFKPSSSAQIDAHARHVSGLVDSLLSFSGGRYFGAMQAQIALWARAALDPELYLVAPGGSDVLGVMGHIRALLELESQVRRGEIPEPDVLVVGVGTCGTLAGILAGLKLTTLQTRVIGVRCVDPIVCRRGRVASLANSALKRLGLSARISASEIDLRDLPKLSYGRPLLEAHDLIREAKAWDGIELDTTYTTKVMAFLRSALRSGELRGQNVLYWHTFSPAAMRSPVFKKELLRNAGPLVQAAKASGA